MPSNNIFHRYLPMTETMYYILLSLTEPRHGYGILLHVKHITAGRVELGAGTIYNSLAKLEADDLIALTAETERRRIYAATKLGCSLLKRELERLKELSKNGMLYLTETIIQTKGCGPT